ncbi:MAG: hypothetical protein AB7O78_17420 [Thermoleophilia bacterium]
MASLPPRRSSAAARLDPIPVAWGGLVASIGLMAGAGRDWPLRLVASAVSFGLGGFLAGVRAAGRRPAHAIGAWIAGYAIHAVFVAIARTIEAFGGREAPALVAGAGRDWLVAAVWAFAFALLGGLVANSWLRPAGRHPR